MNKVKDPVVTVQFCGQIRTMRWDFNTFTELQELGYDFTDGEFVRKTTNGKPLPLKMMRAFACAALNSGADDGATFTPEQVGRTVHADGSGAEIFVKVSELMRLAHGEEEESPLAESAEPASA